MTNTDRPDENHDAQLRRKFLFLPPEKEISCAAEHRDSRRDGLYRAHAVQRLHACDIERWIRLQQSKRV